MSLLDLIFGCSHENTTWPQTVKRDRKWPPELRTYIVCTDCGKEFRYDWNEMRITKGISNGRNREATAVVAGRSAADAYPGS